ncbi:MAG: PHP domain-containing protein [Lachnospiraceae bacterium]|nr:PHP domain-containing protein [Lachnospiraceae bacterium]
MVKADLHIHSTVSDGSDTIEEIIEQAKQKGLDVIAITDHDTLSHLAQIPADPGIRVMGGIEISAVHKETNTRTHILGYNISKPEVITALTQPVLEARNQNSEKQAAILAAHGYHIDMDKLARADGKYLYKQHIMDYLVSTGQAPDMFGEFYHKIFKNGGICAIDIEYIDVFDAVKAIKEAGGMAVLAHPGQQQNFWLVPELVPLGLDGLELNHHANSGQDKEKIKEIAAEYGLFMTGGSDYHGKYEPQPFGIGDFLSDESGVRAVCQK